MCGRRPIGGPLNDNAPTGSAGSRPKGLRPHAVPAVHCFELGCIQTAGERASMLIARLVVARLVVVGLDVDFDVVDRDIGVAAGVENASPIVVSAGTLAIAF